MEKCKHCKKGFKSQAKLEKHEYEQACLPEYSKTYCRICDWTGPNNHAYKEHLISRTHLNTLGQIHVDDMVISSIITNPVTNKLNVMAQLDPVLVDIAKDPGNGGFVDGSGPKLIFNDGSTAKLDGGGEIGRASCRERVYSGV